MFYSLTFKWWFLVYFWYRWIISCYWMWMIILTFLVPIVAPIITPISVEPQVFAGETIQLNCFISRGDSPVSISWFLNGEKISMRGPLISTTQVGSRTSLLTITSATAWHSGDYTCVAENQGGRTNYTVSLLVHGISACILWCSF